AAPLHHRVCLRRGLRRRRARPEDARVMHRRDAGVPGPAAAARSLRALGPAAGRVRGGDPRGAATGSGLRGVPERLERPGDFEAARPWYERLLGEPTFLPHATEAVWTLAEDRSVYLVEHSDGAGNSVVTIFVDDLDALVAAAAARGLEPDERLKYSNGVRKAL